MYMLAIGEFNYGGFVASPDDGILWLSFILGTFIMMVVFMNMLIAIMGNTFNDVMEKQVENSLRENLHLIYDHLWLLDLPNEFKDMKYIIVVVPDITVDTEVTTISTQISEITNQIMVKNDKQYTDIMKRIEAFEKNSRSNQKNQGGKLLTIKTQQKEFREEILKLLGKNELECAIRTPSVLE